MVPLSGLETARRCDGRASDFQFTVWHQARSTDSSCRQQAGRVSEGQDMMHWPATVRVAHHAHVRSQSPKGTIVREGPGRWG